MIFAQLNQDHSPCKTYLIGDGELAMLVDPVLEEVDSYLDELESTDLMLRYVVDTHVHADHISGGAALRDRTGADYIMHKKSYSLCANHKVVDGDLVAMGDLSLRVLHTPGHTRDSISLVLPDRILSGDFLFIGEGGAGRTDLPGGDAGCHWESLAKLAEFPDDMLVFPAHDYHGLTQSTLGIERQQNPRLQARSREAYEQWLEELPQGPAPGISDMVRVNYSSARNPRDPWVPVDHPACQVRGNRGSVNEAVLRPVPVEKLWRELITGSPPHLLDVRQPEEYIGALGRIPGSFLIPIAELPKRLDELTGLENQRICCVCRSGCRSATASAILSVSGFKNAYSLDGGMVAWREYERHRAAQTPRSRLY